MLPLSRVIPALLLGVGVAGVSAGIAAPVFIDARPVLPLNLTDTTWTITDQGATTRLPQDGRQLTVPVTAQWHLSLQEPADPSMVTARVGSTFMRESQQAEIDRLIQAEVWTFPLDRLSRQATGNAELSHTIGMPTTVVPAAGQWFLFPANAEKTTYEVFDETLRTTAPAVFDRKEKREGRTLYVYHQEIPPTNVARLYAGYFNVIQATPEEKGYLHHSATRDFYVDQKTGMLVDLDVAIHDFYGRLDGAELANALTFTGSVSDEDTAALLSQTGRFTNTFLLRIIRWSLIIGGALLALISLLFTFRTPKISKHSLPPVTPIPSLGRPRNTPRQ